MTVLFADLVDSTRLVESLDPEAARDLLNETFRRLAAEVRRFGGTLEKYIGDAILAVFGFPTGHDDDAARAVRAALAMRDIVKTAETALGDVPLHLRIGLDTGEVAAGLVGRPAGDRPGGAHRGPDPAGGRARPDPPVDPDPAGGPRRGRGRPGRAVRPPRPAPAGGGGGGARAVPRRARRRADGRPRVRPAEADRALDHAAHHNRLVLLVGDAGVGKSTLVRAATAEIGDRVHVLWGRCLPDWQSLPFWPVREVLAAAAGRPPPSRPGCSAPRSAGWWPTPGRTRWPPRPPPRPCAGWPASTRTSPARRPSPAPAAPASWPPPSPGCCAGWPGTNGSWSSWRTCTGPPPTCSRWPRPGRRRLPVQGQLAYLGISRPELPACRGGCSGPGPKRIDLDPSASGRPPSCSSRSSAPTRAGAGRPGLRPQQGQPPVRQGAGPRPPGGRPDRPRAAVAAHPRLPPGAGRGQARPADAVVQARPVPGGGGRQVVLARRPDRHGPAGRRSSTPTWTGWSGRA